MGIFFSYDENGMIAFNEIEAKPETNDTSTTDYTQDDEQNQTPDNGGGDNPQDAPEDYTISDNGDDGEEQTPEEADGNPPEEGTEATGGDQPAEGDNGGAGDNGTTDYTDDGGGGEDMGGGDGGSDPNAGGGEGEGGDDMDDGGGMDDNSSQSEDDIKALEDEIYSNYSDEQRKIMTKELKGSMNKLVTLSSDLVDRINDIPKVSAHIRIIEFVSNKLSEFRDMLIDYLYYTFDTESYVKNQIAYKRFLTIMRQIDELISKIPTVDEVKNKNDNDQD